VIPCQYRYKWYIVKDYISLAYISAAESIRVSSATFTQSAQKAAEFGEIKQPLGLLRRSRSFKVTKFGTNRKLICDFLLVINGNLPLIFHRLRDIALERSKIATFFYTSLVYPPTERFPRDDLPKIFTEGSQMAKVPSGVETLRKISIAWVECTNVTDDRQTDDDIEVRTLKQETHQMR